MVPKQIKRKVHQYTYMQCIKEGHECQELSLICLNSQCKSNRLSCCHCESEQHQTHPLIPLKEYILHIYHQKQQTKNLAIPTVISNKHFMGYEKLQNQTAKINYLSYLQSIEDSKLSLTKSLHQLKQKVISQISLLETHIQVNSQKFIDKIKLISQLYFSNEDILQKLSALSTKHLKAQLLLEDFIENMLPPQLNDQKSSDESSKHSSGPFSKDDNPSCQKIFAQVHESFTKKAINLQKSLQNIDFNFFPKLNKLIEYDNIKFSNLSNFQWDPLYKAEGFEITDSQHKIIRVKFKSNDEQRVALMKTQFLKESKNKSIWAIKISKLNGWIGVGLALRKVVVEAKYKFNYNTIGHGMYMLSANGYTWSHSQAENNSKYQGFSFLTGDILVMQFNPMTRQLQFKKIDGKDGNPTKTLKVADYLNEDFLCPCVNMLSKNDEVEIVPVPEGFFF